MKAPKTYVIQQDEHLQNLRKIIKRDFFQTQQQKQNEPQQVIELGLNDYLKNFKSNENQIFAELVHNDSQQWKKKHEWMQKSKQLMIQSGKPQRPYTNMIAKDPGMKAIDYSIVKQDPKNAIFFSPTRQTKSYNDPQHDKAKKVYYDNCRIKSEEVQRAKIYEYKYRVDPNLQVIPETPILQGKNRMADNQNLDYSIKRAPSPQPQKMPIMTWGQVESTPMRINGSEYRIPETSNRDKLLEQLTTKITKQKMIKKNKKDEIKLKILSSVRPIASSYRKVSVARENSEIRGMKLEENKNNKLDALFNVKKQQ